MSSFTGSAGADVVRMVDGVTYRFTRPKRRQVADQMAQWAAEDKAALVRLLDETKVEPKDRFEILREHERRSRLYVYGALCAHEFARAGDILRSACGKEPDTLPFSIEEQQEIALELWGIAPEKKAGPRPLDEKAETTTSPTGSSLTPESAAGSTVIQVS